MPPRRPLPGSSSRSRVVAPADVIVTSSLKSESPAAQQRRDAAARSAALAGLFDRLAAADARLRRGETGEGDDGYADGNDADGTGGGVGGADTASHRAVGGTAASSPTAAANPRHQSGAVILRSGRAVVLSAGSRRLPPIFQEQARTLRNVETSTADVQNTLQQLHRDLIGNTRHYNNGGGAQRDNTGALLTAAGSTSGGVGEMESATTPTTTTTAAVERRIAEAEARAEAMRVQRARAAAADEGAADDQSVEDYGVDCEVPQLVADSNLADEVSCIATHFAKAKESALVMEGIEESNPTGSEAPWWSSALRMRDMKASAARLDYHAHAALNWSFRAREQLLLQAATLNNVSASTRAELLHQQEHFKEFQERLRDGQHALTELQAEIAHWQAAAQTETVRRASLQDALLVAAQEGGLVDAEEGNPLKAELALLLKEHVWPSRSLQRDAQVVGDWLRSVATPLE